VISYASFSLTAIRESTAERLGAIVTAEPYRAFAFAVVLGAVGKMGALERREETVEARRALVLYAVRIFGRQGFEEGFVVCRLRIRFVKWVGEGLKAGGPKQITRTRRVRGKVRVGSCGNSKW